jgi:pimeloyl-ACP methyl ester carboxylesterase
MPADALILLPGLLCDSSLFAAQLPALAAVTRVEVAEVGGASSMAGLAEDVLRRAPPRFALLGLSMGGSIAFEIWRQAPERVSRLALLDTQARADTPEITERRRVLMDLARSGAFGQVTPRLWPMLVHPDRQGDPALAATVTGMAEAIGPEAFLRQEQALIDRIDSRPTLAAIACPTLVLVGRQDRLTPLDRHEEMAAAIPGATLVVLPDCGHLSPLEQPAAVTRQLLAWLDA